MALFSWFFRKSPAKSVPGSDSSGLSRMEPTRPVHASRGRHPEAAPGEAGNRKSERLARRELLYGVVRESMVRSGVLSASYKFKVLALDKRGRQFMVMMDLASQFGGETGRLAEIEALIAQSAKARYDILVTAVYWRLNEHVAVGRPSALPPHSQPAPLMPEVSQPAPLSPQAAPAMRDLDKTMPMPRYNPADMDKTMPMSRYEPIQEDEVSAFKRALAAGVSGAAAVAAASPEDPHHKAERSYTLLTGYEDTEMVDPDARAPALSATQYGDLN
ncbi:MAG: hypothetical protein IPK34_10700 [Ramlibacter sp.]|nr:hypothetical protein [Ramlibacter sp.]